MRRSSASSLMGLGCSCNKALGDPSATADNPVDQAQNDLSDYDQITVGGTLYSANEIVDKNLIAEGPVPLYYGGDFNNPFYTVPAGQNIGQVYSYIKPTDATGMIAGTGLLEFYTSDNRAYYVKDEAAINQADLQVEGAKTSAQDTSTVQAAAAKAADPVGYYLKTYGLPVLLIAGAIYLAATFGKEALHDKLSKA